MDFGLKDRVYIVTGGTRGLGRAAAHELVADGVRVVVSGRSEKSVASAEAEPVAGGRWSVWWPTTPTPGLRTG